MNSVPQILAQADASQRGGDLATAEQLYRRALAAEPNHVGAHTALGALLAQQGRWADAAENFRQVVALQPGVVGPLNNLAAAAVHQQNWDEAVVCWRRIVALQPDAVDVHANLAIVATQQNRLDEAADGWRRVLQLRPDFAEAMASLAGVLARQQKLAEADACYRRAVELYPGMPAVYNDWAGILRKQGRLDDAAACLRKALALKPDFAEAHMHLGFVLERQGQLDEAVASLRRAVELKANYAEAYDNLGGMLARQGIMDKALACFQKAVAAKPSFAAARSNVLLSLQYREGISLAELAAAHAEFEAQHAAPLRAAWRKHDNARDPERTLRVAFVSPDFGFHPVGVFLVRLLENLDRRLVHTVCYSDRRQDDAMTARLRSAAGEWRESRGWNDQQLAEQLRTDQIDVAFDLAGHTSNNRLLMFARKPAPVQITWMGYVGTTGLAAMDYLLADRFQVPPTAEAHLPERVLRMPDDYVCYDPPAYAPEVSPLPAIERGHVTFGNFNNLAKTTIEVIDLWTRILQRVEGSRLVLKCRGLDAPSTTRRITELFVTRGVDSSRLTLLGWTTQDDVLREYQGLDVALDPFPYSGGLTTCEALWMGVPVVTCPGETFASRHSLTHLSNVGLTETIAADRDKYVELAVGLAADLPRLAKIRAALRPQMAASPLCDGPRFAENFAAVVREAWRAWCAKPTGESSRA